MIYNLADPERRRGKTDKEKGKRGLKKKKIREKIRWTHVTSNWTNLKQNPLISI